MLEIEISKNNFLDIVAQSSSKSQVARELGIDYINGTVSRAIQKLIDRYGADTSHFNSGAARRKYPRKLKKCANKHCNKMFEAIVGSAKEKITCSRACSNTHFRSKENHPNWQGMNTVQYRKKALREYEAKCFNTSCEIKKAGIEIPTSMLDIDHIDSDRSNNKIENLQPLCVWCHALKTRKVNI